MDVKPLPQNSSSVPEGEVFYSLGDKIGFVRLVDAMPSQKGEGDTAIVEAARVSYAKGTKVVSTDEALIRYLMRHSHTTPFEMVVFKFHIKCPLFVARQIVRHRTASLNEASGRYSILEDQFYTPSPLQMRKQSTTNKQGSSPVPLDDKVAQDFSNDVREISRVAYEKYMSAVNGGVARELARMLLPVNIYTQFYWKMDLHNLFHFLQLRMDSHAQQEIQCYARDIFKLIQPYVPFAVRAFLDYRINSTALSTTELRALSLYLPPDAAPQLDTKSKTEDIEWREKYKKFHHH